jgi:hypothetical protein
LRVPVWSNPTEHCECSVGFDQTGTRKAEVGFSFSVYDLNYITRKERRLLALFASDVVKVIDAEAKANFRFAGAGLVKPHPLASASMTLTTSLAKSASRRRSAINIIWSVLSRGEHTFAGNQRFIHIKKGDAHPRPPAQY